MDEIINALTSASVWAGVIITISLQLVFKHSPRTFKKFLQGSKLKYLKKIKKLRHNPDAVTYQSIKASAYFLLFCGCSAFFLILVFIGPLAPLLELPKWVFFSAFSPILFLEFMWLSQRSFALSLIEYRGKLRVPRCSRSHAASRAP
jgi:hypothetical protein